MNRRRNTILNLIQYVLDSWYWIFLYKIIPLPVVLFGNLDIDSQEYE